MMPLETSENVLKWLCVYSPDESSSKWKKRAYVATGLSVFLANVTGLVVSVVFFMKFVSTDLGSSLHALFQIAGLVNAIYGTIVIQFSRQKIAKVFDHLSIIYDENRNADSFRYLAQANNKSEWLWKLFFKFVFVFALTIAILSAASVSVCLIINGNFDSNRLFHPYRIVLPWDQRTPYGYLAEICISVASGDSYIFFNGVLLMFFISISWHHQAFYKMFRLSIRKLSRTDNHQHQKELLCHLIRFHISVKDWFLTTADIFSLYIMIQLICSMMLMACAMFQLDLQFHHVDYELSIVLLAALSGASNLFLWCFFGKSSTESFLKINESLYESDWHELPVELQKYIILMHANMQRPLYYDGFGIAFLNLETFCNMLRAVITYYMMFKTLTQ